MEKKCSKSNSPLQCVVVESPTVWSMRRFHLQPQIRKSISAFHTACEEKAYAPGCTYLGDMYWKGVGVAEDRDKADAYFEKPELRYLGLPSFG